MNNVLAGLALVFFIAFFILSIVLFVKRKKIIAKYNVGYISSFFFAAYMLAPLMLGASAMLGNAGEEARFGLIMSLIYPLVGLAVFMFVYRNEPMDYKVGKFFAMLGLGICSALILVFKMLTFFINLRAVEIVGR